MTILKSQVKTNTPDFIENKKKLNIDYELTLNAVNIALDGG